MSFARCSVTLDMPKPVEGAIALLLFKGSLLRSSDAVDPWFCLVEEVKIGLSTTYVTEAECVEPGSRGNIPAGRLVDVSGYPGLRVSNSQATGGRGNGGVEIVDSPPSTGTQLARMSTDPRIVLGELTDIATLVRMNLHQLECLVGDPLYLQLLVEAAQRPKRDFHTNFRLLLGEVYSTVARVVIASEVRPELPPIAMGFHKTRLVFLSLGQVVKLNRLPGEGRLLLPSESALLSG